MAGTENRIVIMDFSHVYEMETFYKRAQVRWLDCTDMSGTDGYCDEAGKAAIRRKIGPLPPEGIHFIDGGNYHYVSELWLEKIKRDFALAVFDHHSDMQKPLFGDILSCGSWILNTLEHNPYVRRVLLIGLSEEQEQTIPDRYKDRIRCISADDLKEKDTWSRISGLHTRLPVYISVDKDVLSEHVVDTTWDQGDMTLAQLKALMHLLIRTEHVIGIDICGECTAQLDSLSAIEENDDVNRALLAFLDKEKEQKSKGRKRSGS
ncbi:MAG TPA: arginase family protein [Candidatus Eubacterium avistercoris]|uniref:Arginase family protein n=1 Tax=Candidatus Eubacterium avistercoris TaxID=2838567 RepID=A0A9D2D4N6_9FIRM|nr:arginase family protein [Candidatus Eubacterium avistercoris]